MNVSFHVYDLCSFLVNEEVSQSVYVQSIGAQS